MLALHLLQNCMVYVNTLMLQRVLGKPIWLERMGTNERRAMDAALLGPREPLWHFPARHDRPLAPRSADVGRQRRSATTPRRLTVQATRYFASGDTNVGSRRGTPGRESARSVTLPTPSCPNARPVRPSAALPPMGSHRHPRPRPARSTSRSGSRDPRARADCPCQAPPRLPGSRRVKAPHRVPAPA